MVTIAPENIRIIPNAKGKPAGVLIDMQTWESILEALELADDLPIIKQALADLKSAGGDPIKAGFIPWSEARAKLEKMDAKK
ncbi:MAG: hypothetical protein ACOYYJ_21460 [Chloroflexota bacterium]